MKTEILNLESWEHEEIKYTVSRTAVVYGSLQEVSSATYVERVPLVVVSVTLYA